MSYREQNRAAWDRLAQREAPFAKVATDEECRDPLGTLDSRGWLPDDVSGRDVLCLAAAGGFPGVAVGRRQIYSGPSPDAVGCRP